VAVDAIGVGPVALDRDGAEAALGDQPARDAGARLIELVRAVRGLAQQHEARVADAAQQLVELVVAAAQRNGRRARGLDLAFVRPRRAPGRIA